MVIKYRLFSYIIGLAVLFSSCKKEEYSMGTLTAPTNLKITTEVVGQDATHPDGDGSGEVKITVSADNALSYKVDYDASDALDLVHLPKGTTTKKYTNVGTHTYRITLVAFGAGASTSTTTADVTVRSDFEVDESIIENLTGGSSKTWIVDKDLPGHFGVGPWNAGSTSPEWWSAPPNDKAGCCNCFYTSTFTFKKNAATGTFSMDVASPDGAFTKTGALAGGLPGIPASGDEGCYSYAGGSSAFTFVPSSSGVAETTPSTKTAIQLAGNTTYIGYGAVKKEYEILSISESAMYLRVQGTETGNAWYLKLKAQ